MGVWNQAYRSLRHIVFAGLTHTSEGLKLVRDEFVANLRPGVRGVLIVLTDGVATKGYEPTIIAKEIRDKDVTVYAIGVKGTWCGVGGWVLSSTPLPTHTYIHTTPPTPPPPHPQLHHSLCLCCETLPLCVLCDNFIIFHQHI